MDPILLSATIYLFFFLCPCFVSVLSLFLYPLQCREYSGPILLSAGIKQGKQGISQTDRGKGPEFGNEGDLHCLQKGLILSQTECLYIKDLVLNKDLFGILGPC